MTRILVIVSVGFGIRADAPSPASRPATRVLDIAYGTGARMRLDLYVPARRGFATVVYTYGGGWHAGSNKSSTPIARMLQRHGYACALVNHRVWPPDEFPAHAEDLARAVSWVEQHIAAYGGQEKRIFLAGHSSGAHLSLLLATDATYLSSRSIDSATIRGVIGLSTPVDLGPRADSKGFGDVLMRGRGADAFGRDLRKMSDASPIRHISKSMPPVLLVVGDHDFPMLADDARDFQSRARGAGGSVEVLVAERCDHMAVARSMLDETSPVLRRVLEFLGERDAPAEASASRPSR